jgi:hypothetical protein
MTESISYGLVFAGAFILETMLIPYYEITNVYIRAQKSTKRFYV